MTNHASTHRAAVALVAHYRRGDAPAMLATLTDMTGESLAAVNMALVGLVSAALDAHPADPDDWLNEAALHLAATEGDGPPPVVG